MNDLKETFGKIDIYLFDQLLKGNYDNCRKIIDVGCGSGRNIHYLLKHGFEVYGIDPNPEAIEIVKSISKELSPSNDPDNFKIGVAEAIPFKTNYFDLAICSAVLHFASEDQHFEAMVSDIWRTIKAGGFFFARLASSIGIEDKIATTGSGQYLLSDGSVRYLVNEEQLLNLTANLGGSLTEPIKTTNVQNLRCMTTWCMQKL